MNNVTHSPARRRFIRFEPWPTAIVLFFIVVLAVNAFFIRMSMLTWTGLVTEGAYVKGLAFNQVLKAQEEQNGLGWRATLDVSGLSVGSTQALRVSLRDRQDQPLTGARIQGRLVRPVHQGYDQLFSMTEGEPGRYEAPVTVPLPGQWDIKLEVMAPVGTFRHVQRVYLPTDRQGG
ncbi:MAG: FixH family protein [Magnetococcus sp. DMHC-8]